MTRPAFAPGDRVTLALHRNARPLVVVRVRVTGRVTVRGRNNRLLTLWPYQLRRVG